MIRSTKDRKGENSVMVRKLAMIALVFGLVVSVHWSQPSTASACDDWQGYSSCVDSAESRLVDCCYSCSVQWPNDGTAFEQCCGRCDTKFEQELCYCYLNCDPTAWCF